MQLKKLFALLALLFVGTTYHAHAASINETRKVVTDDGSERDYWLYVPERVKLGIIKNAPLVLALHGGSEDYQPTHSGNLNFNSLAESNNFVVAYPRGKERQFPHFNPNAARAWLATGAENEDTRYLESIIDTISKMYGIDSNRIYMAGFSVGGMMTYAASNVLPHKIAAFASISGFPMNEVHLRHTAGRPVPFLHVHGTKDGFVRFDHTPTIIYNMLNRNGLSYTPNAVATGNANVWGDGNTKYKRSEYGKDTKNPYIFYQIGTGSGSSDTGMGHNNWCSIAGKDVQQVMWEFFRKYRLSDERDTDIEFKADVNTANTDARDHGWTINSGEKILVKYGESGGYSTSTQNVYHTIQLNAGTHYLKFKTANAEEDQYVTVRLSKLGSLSNFDKLMGNTPSGNYFVVKNQYVINNATYPADNQQTIIEFTTDEPAELMLTILKGNKNDQTQISEIEITKTGIPTAISAVTADNEYAAPGIYDLSGRKINAKDTQSLPKGIYVVNGKKIKN